MVCQILCGTLRLLSLFMWGSQLNGEDGHVRTELWTRFWESAEDGVVPFGQGEMGVARGSGMLPGVGDTGAGSTGMNLH